jgi:hypothetical protein
VPELADVHQYGHAHELLPSLLGRPGEHGAAVPPDLRHLDHELHERRGLLGHHDVLVESRLRARCRRPPRTTPFPAAAQPST